MPRVRRSRAEWRERRELRAVFTQEITDHPERYYPCRGLIADIETGLVYGVKLWPIGSPDSSGYLQIDGGSTLDHHAVGAHIVVWESVNGPVPEGKEINHINGIKTDNRLSNLEAITHRSNIVHSYRTGLASNQGERHPLHKLTDDDVREIRKLHNVGWTKKDLASKFSVVRRTINDITLFNTWTHVKDGE